MSTVKRVPLSLTRKSKTTKMSDINVILLNGEKVLVADSTTFNELKQKAANAGNIAAMKLQIYANGTMIDLDQSGETKICDFKLEDADCYVAENVTEINIGRSLESGAKLGNAKAIDDALVNAAMVEKTAPTPVLRGYTGHVAQKKFSYGIANSLADKDHMVPRDIAEQQKNGIHYKPDITLGYKGFIRGSQHVAGRTYRNSLEATMNAAFEDLAQGSLLPAEPQHYGQTKRFSLDDPSKHIITL